MRLGELILTLLAASSMPLGILYLYEKIYNYNYDEERDDLNLDEEKDKGCD